MVRSGYIYYLTCLFSFFYENTCPAVSALVRAPGIPCFWLRSLFTFLRSPLKTTNSQKLLERQGTTAIPRQIYLPTRERETDLPKRENARVTPLSQEGRKTFFISHGVLY